MRRRLSGAPAVPFLKSYIVFNVEQIAGLPEHYYAKPGAKRPEPQRIEHAEQFFAATKADIRHGGPRAFYSPAGDFIKRCCTISGTRRPITPRSRRIWLLRTFRSANRFYNAPNAFKAVQSAWSSSDRAIFRRG
jgi:hypothetical protein